MYSFNDSLEFYSRIYYPWQRNQKHHFISEVTLKLYSKVKV